MCGSTAATAARSHHDAVGESLLARTLFFFEGLSHIPTVLTPLLLCMRAARLHESTQKMKAATEKKHQAVLEERKAQEEARQAREGVKLPSCDSQLCFLSLFSVKAFNLSSSRSLP